MSTNLELLSAQLKLALGAQITKFNVAFDEISLECKADDLLNVCAKLRDHAELKFEQLIDLCGVDYSDFKDGTYEGARYAVVLHLL